MKKRDHDTDLESPLGLADEPIATTPSDHLEGGDPLLDDAEIAADLAAARAAGRLHDGPADAWGNAAIPGFGIGRPVREPEIHEAAHGPALAGTADAERYARTFEIAPDTLVIAAAPDVPLVVAAGPPEAAAERHERAFLAGLVGAVIAIASAMWLAISVGGGSAG